MAFFGATDPETAIPGTAELQLGILPAGELVKLNEKALAVRCPPPNHRDHPPPTRPL
jgi:hypothetical protein